MSGNGNRTRAERNRTITLSEQDRAVGWEHLITDLPDEQFDQPPEGVILGDQNMWVPKWPEQSVDLLFLDPPYNLDKAFRGRRFSRRSVDEYTAWLDRLLEELIPLLKPDATVYICAEWYTSTSVFLAASNYLVVRNRITWQREKGRGAKENWKNSSEDIWFCTVGDHYTFNVDAVKLRRRVLAPYRDRTGRPKQWDQTPKGRFRDTHPSNLWDDITVPFWSMPENTDHPTQKSEKLLAKLVLASTDPGDYILDPFLGSGTTTAVAEKLGRRGAGIELDEEYALLAQRRLLMARQDDRVQGYADKIFWERNTSAAQNAAERQGGKTPAEPS